MQKFSKNGIEWLQFDQLSDIPSLEHAVFLRHGGHSHGPFHSLNASNYVGDNPSHVQANMQAIESVLQHNIPEKIQLFRSTQCHGTQVATIDPTSPQETKDRDGLITNAPRCALLMTHADCQAALFYDPIQRAIANVHAGWRGSVANIYRATIQSMQHSFGSRPSDILACIGPSLGPDNAEFIHYKKEIPSEYWQFQVKPTYFDFWAISDYQLRQLGILPHHIEIARINTYSNPQDYFSYRRDKVTGRHVSCIIIK